MTAGGHDRHHSADTPRILFSLLDGNGEPLLPYYRRDLWVLSGLALALRLGYLWLGAQTQSVADVCMWAHDSKTYLAVAQYWLTGDALGRQELFATGPGYGWLLAGSQLVFGTTLWPPVLLNIALGCVAPVVVYLTAMTLVRRRSVALIAGMIVSISTTGLSLSVSLLTDQPFYTLHALAIVLFVCGLKSNATRWFVAAGVTAGTATYIRAMGQVWPIVFVFMALLAVFQSDRLRRWRRFRRTLWTPAILFLLIVCWSFFNLVRYDAFTFTSNGAHAAWLYLSSRAIAMHTPGLTAKTVRTWAVEDLEKVAENSTQPATDMYHKSRSEFFRLVRDEPMWLARAFWLSVRENTQAPNYLLYTQLPQFKRVWDVYTRQARDALNAWIFWIAAAGLVMLFVDRKQLAWIITGPAFIVFTLLTGFSFWQGSRLHFPAEMAWSILFAYSLVRTREAAIAWLQRRSSEV